MTTPSTSPPAPAWRRDLPLVTYSAGNFGKNLLLSSVDVTLLFMLTDILGLSPVAVGQLMLAVLLGDLIFDIGSGVLASWAQPYGFDYRRIIAWGALPCSAGFALLFALPALDWHSGVLIAAILLGFRGAYAIIDVPHNSLLARVAPGSHARGRASGYRLFFSTLASLATALVLAPAVMQAAHRGQPLRLALIGAAGGALACLALWISAMRWRRSEREPAPAIHAMALLPRFDPLFLAVACIALITGFAMPMFGRMTFYLASYVYDQPALASRLLLAVTLGQLPGVLLWTWGVRHAEKTTLLALSHALTILSIALFAMVGPGWLIPAAGLIGLALAGVFMLPWGIVADAVDFAQMRHGTRRETAAFAAVLVMIKASGAASIGLIGWTLGHLGYVAGAAQPPSVVMGMKIMGLGVPVLGSAVAILLLTRMSLGHARHASVLRVLNRRARRSAGG
ncbi:MFS transporter [Novosphingobium sp.]|uniref:MFS transporter n=1 Tax=Novosphingobium sp. TaxID=1874826 RepID=UPI0031DDCBCB